MQERQFLRDNVAKHNAASPAEWRFVFLHPGFFIVHRNIFRELRV